MGKASRQSTISSRKSAGLERANGDLTEVKRFPDVIIRKKGKDVLVIDAKCMRYSEIMPVHKQEPGPPRDIVNHLFGL